jgi:Cu(I)/Ag(I) efflux system periplasmic protein CusF
MKTAPPAASQTGKGVGVVTEVDRKVGTLTIKHGPIAAFKWPAMTMTFHAQPASLLNGVTAGQKISFDATLFNGAPQVTAIRKQKGGRRRCPNGCAPAHAAA